MWHAQLFCNPGLMPVRTVVVGDREDMVLSLGHPSMAVELEETVVRMTVRGELVGEGAGETCLTSWSIDGREASAVVAVCLQSCHNEAPHGSDNRHWLGLIEQCLEVLRT